MNRDEMYKLVRSQDPKDRITRRSIFGDLASAAPVKFAANETAWTGKGYECHFCHEKFNSLNGLNDHLNSDIRTYKPLSQPPTTPTRHHESAADGTVVYEQIQTKNHCTAVPTWIASYSQGFDLSNFPFRVGEVPRHDRSQGRQTPLPHCQGQRPDSLLRFIHGDWWFCGEMCRNLNVAAF
jgi:hypothetical protein